MKTRIIAITLLVFALSLLFSGCAMFDDAAKLTEYDFDTDKVATINAVLGEQRKVIGISTGTENGVQYKQYTYQTESMMDDLIAYSLYLQEHGWIITEDYNLNDAKGEMQFAIDSADAGKILVISVAFEQTQYAIRVNKLVGELTMNDF
jgi:hypothetical protein